MQKNQKKDAAEEEKKEKDETQRRTSTRGKRARRRLAPRTYSSYYAFCKLEWSKTVFSRNTGTIQWVYVYLPNGLNSSSKSNTY